MSQPLVPLDDDVGNNNEENVIAGIRRNAMEFHAHDIDHNRKRKLPAFDPGPSGYRPFPQLFHCLPNASP